MEMISQLLIGLVAIGVATTSHYLVLARVQELVNKIALSKYTSLLTVCYGITLSQLLCTLWFAMAFEVSLYFGLGHFADPTVGFIDIFYFSLINLTTLGMAQVEPFGHINLLMGLEAMTGFLLVSCSASMIFKIMNRGK
jgi:hypothetical protein|tara:strand:+ start:2673 stop:3089 length:417 start_codon:yes stop_codon:yes gene_type:complete